MEQTASITHRPSRLPSPVFGVSPGVEEGGGGVVGSVVGGGVVGVDEGGGVGLSLTNVTVAPPLGMVPVSPAEVVV